MLLPIAAQGSGAGKASVPGPSAKGGCTLLPPKRYNFAHPPACAQCCLGGPRYEFRPADEPSPAGQNYHCVDGLDLECIIPIWRAPLLRLPLRRQIRQPF